MTLRDENTATDYVIGVHDDPAGIDGEAWNALLEAQARPRGGDVAALEVQVTAVLRPGSACTVATSSSPPFSTAPSAAATPGQRDGRSMLK